MGGRSYADACRAFTWDGHAHALGWAGADAVSLGETIVDRHAAVPRLALRWLGRDGDGRDITFAELSRLTDRGAAAFAALGVEPGDRVAGFLPRVPETIVAMIATWKAGAIYVPIFTGFGADALAYRLTDSRPKVVVTHRDHRARVRAGAAAVVTIGGAGDEDFVAMLAAQPAGGLSRRRRRDEPAVLLYTSGSTGPPKGVAIATNFLLAVQPYLTYGIDLRSDDVFWPTGDPGWGYGLVCYMAALARGVGVVMHEASPTPVATLERLRDAGVTNLATTPTLLRGIMALGRDVVSGYDVRVRRASSCGEPLNAEVVAFFRTVWDVTVMDHYGASELGLPIGNFNALDVTVKPGSMGLPMPGSVMSVVDDDGRELPPGVVGHVAMRPSPDGYYALGYWHDEARTRDGLRGGWVTIGDLARRDADGYFWFEGRADDVIKTAGYRVGPFEVESALLGHPAVAEAAVIGVPDAVRGHVVKAFVVTRAGAGTPALAAELIELVRECVGRPEAPRQIVFVPELPKTETGKIQRFRLRQAEAEAGREAP